MAKKAKNISHEEVSEAMARFLKKGGVIEKIEYNDNGFLLKNDLSHAFQMLQVIMLDYII